MKRFDRFLDDAGNEHVIEKVEDGKFMVTIGGTGAWFSVDSCEKVYHGSMAHTYWKVRN